MGKLCAFLLGMREYRLMWTSNVHAFVRGEVVSVGQGTPPRDKWVRATYNPYKYESFVIADTEEPIFSAREVVIEDKRIYVWI